jgi:hypothetical protein
VYEANRVLRSIKALLRLYEGYIEAQQLVTNPQLRSLASAF